MLKTGREVLRRLRCGVERTGVDRAFGLHFADGLFCQITIGADTLGQSSAVGVEFSAVGDDLLRRQARECCSVGDGGIDRLHIGKALSLSAAGRFTQHNVSDGSSDHLSVLSC
ncbi:hypothetical protein [Aureimonas sp. AU20]|uniref:hypothetical protein n=1 Tax=Aureimonas sp. AU20 TaxID=1349819 RepID=UPI0011DFBDEC|nr:hypothetical protein [Aureimonas sp. AU20]